MWYASLDSPAPSSHTASAGQDGVPGSARSSSAKAAPSPMEMPLRPASQGRQGSAEVSSSEAKPYSVVRHSESTPPTSAASMVPSASWRAAAANTLALDEHAVEMVAAMPVMPR